MHRAMFTGAHHGNEGRYAEIEVEDVTASNGDKQLRLAVENEEDIEFPTTKKIAISEM